jgi:hypothetical protein
LFDVRERNTRPKTILVNWSLCCIQSFTGTKSLKPSCCKYTQVFRDWKIHVICYFSILLVQILPVLFSIIRLWSDGNP